MDPAAVRSSGSIPCVCILCRACSGRQARTDGGRHAQGHRRRACAEHPRVGSRRRQPRRMIRVVHIGAHRPRSHPRQSVCTPAHPAQSLVRVQGCAGVDCRVLEGCETFSGRGGTRLRRDTGATFTAWVHSAQWEAGAHTHSSLCNSGRGRVPGRVCPALSSAHFLRRRSPPHPSPSATTSNSALIPELLTVPDTNEQTQLPTPPPPMATPSSSTTTPSPRPSFLQAAVVVPPPPLAVKELALADDDQRQSAIQKILANAEVSSVSPRRFSSPRGAGPCLRAGQGRRPPPREICVGPRPPCTRRGPAHRRASFRTRNPVTANSI